MEFYQALILIITANAAPLLASYIFPFKYWDLPLDFNKTLPDQQPVLGHSKTFRGLIASVLATCAVSWYFGMGIITGITVSALAMLGDIFSSFLKRRLGYDSGKMALGLDQVAESMLPLYYIHATYHLSLFHVAAGIILFAIVDIVFTSLIAKFHQLLHSR